MDVLTGFAVRIWRRQRPLTLVTVGSAALLAVAMVLGLLDGRQVGGAPVWLKPAKFAAAILTTAPVLAWILDQMPRSSRLRAAGTATAAVSAFELGLITLQAARGVRSHFNHDTLFDTALFSAMGAAITLFWLAELFIAVRAFRWSFATPARTWAIRLGLAGALAGGGVGFLMAAVGAHTVGAPDGGAGLPLTRWSATAGDLRIAHFLGLHALQALPLLALFLERRRRPAAAIVVRAATIWLGAAAVTLVQALRGQPLLAVDAVTVAGALAVGALGLLPRPAPRAPAILAPCTSTPAGSSRR